MALAAGCPLLCFGRELKTLEHLGGLASCAGAPPPSGSISYPFALVELMGQECAFWSLRYSRSVFRMGAVELQKTHAQKRTDERYHPLGEH